MAQKTPIAKTGRNEENLYILLTPPQVFSAVEWNYMHFYKLVSSKKLTTLFVLIFARINFRVLLLRENKKFSRGFIFAHLPQKFEIRY